MKYKLCFLVALMATTLSAQNVGSINQVAIPYTVLIKYHQSLLDTGIIARAGVKKATITITDSTQVRTLPKGKCEEFMTYNFLRDGKVKKANYSISHPEVKLNGTITYQYPSKNSVLIGDYCPSSYRYHAYSYFYQYSPSDNILSEKKWYASYSPDTTDVPFTRTENKYSSEGVLTNSRSWLETMQTRELWLASTKKEETKTTSFYYSYLLGAPDTMLFEENCLYDSQGRVIEKVSTFKNDTMSSETWNYDTAGNLVSYSHLNFFMGYPERETLMITRNEKGLPTRVVYIEKKGSFVFDFKWE